MMRNVQNKLNTVSAKTENRKRRKMYGNLF